MVHQYLGRTIQHRNHCIDPSIIVEIAESSTAVRSRNGETCLRTNILKRKVTPIAKHAVGKRKRPMLNLHGVVENGSIRSEQILESIVVEVKCARSPRSQAARRSGQS